MNKGRNFLFGGKATQIDECPSPPSPPPSPEPLPPPPPTYCAPPSEGVCLEGGGVDNDCCATCGNGGCAAGYTFSTQTAIAEGGSWDRPTDQGFYPQCGQMYCGNTCCTPLGLEAYVTGATTDARSMQALAMANAGSYAAGTATFCSNADGSGTCCTKTPGRYGNGNDGAHTNSQLTTSPCPSNDQISYIDITGSCTVAVYEHSPTSSGAAWFLTGPGTFAAPTHFGDNTISDAIVCYDATMPPPPPPSDAASQTWNQAHEQCNAAHATGIDATCCIGSDIAQQCECAGRRRELSPFHENTRGRELGHCCDYGAYCDCSTLAHAKPNPPSPVAETSLLANLCLLVSHSAGGTAQRLLS